MTHKTDDTKGEYNVERHKQEQAALRKYAAIQKAAEDKVGCQKVYIDMTGEWEAALVLDEIIFFTLPRGEKVSALRVWKEGQLWLAVQRSDWWDRKRLTARQADRAIQKLEDLNLIVKSVHKFNGQNTVHMRLNTSEFFRQYAESLEKDNPPENQDDTITKDLADLYKMMGVSGLPNGDLPNGELPKSNTGLPNGDARLPNGDFLTPLTTSLTQPSPQSETKKSKLPKGSGIDFLMASGATSEEIAAQLADDQAERDLLNFYESKMGYGTTLDWWGKDGDLCNLREFLVTKTQEDIETFAKWCKRPYSKFGPENAKRYPRDVMTFWPMAFGEKQNNSGIEKPSTDGKGFYA